MISAEKESGFISDSFSDTFLSIQLEMFKLRRERQIQAEMKKIILDAVGEVDLSDKVKTGEIY